MKWHAIAGLVSIVACLLLGGGLFLWVQVARLAMAGAL